jgi:hypothetical protein
MRKNVGSLDAMIRITIGLFGLVWAGSHLVRSRRRLSLFVAFLAAMKVAEGMIRFCPGLALLGVNTLDEDNHNKFREAPSPTHKKPPQSSTEERGVDDHE